MLDTQNRMVRDFGILTFVFFAMASVPGLNPTVASKLGDAGLVTLSVVTTLLRVIPDEDIKKDIKQIKSNTSESNNAISDVVINPVVPTTINQVTRIEPDLTVVNKATVVNQEKTP